MIPACMAGGNRLWSKPRSICLLTQAAAGCEFWPNFRGQLSEPHLTRAAIDSERRTADFS